MQTCIDRYVGEDLANRPGGLSILDVGGQDVNGGYRGLFKQVPLHAFVTTDLEAAPGVDVVMDDPYRLPFPDCSFDIVISGQMLEHCPQFWRTFAEMVRVQRTDGLLFLIAPSAGPIHRYPVDCYRFHPDAFATLAELNGCKLIDCWLDTRGPWRDLTGVFARSDAIRKIDRSPYRSPIPTAVRGHPDPAAEKTSGVASYLETLKLCHDRLRPELYVEIGVRWGDSLCLANRTAIGIDPAPDLRRPISENVTIVVDKSDNYFTSGAPGLTRSVDLAFIDGMHLFEYTLRDFINLERRARSTSLIVIDDIYPNHPLQAQRDRVTAAWTGDVWKLASLLAAARPDLLMLSLDTKPTGLLLVTALDPSSSKLLDSYNPLVRAWQRPERTLPPSVLTRRGALSPLDPSLPRILDTLRALSATDATQMDVRTAVQAVLNADDGLTEIVVS